MLVPTPLCICGRPLGGHQTITATLKIQDLTGAERREWMGMGEGDSHDDYGSFPHSLLSTSKRHLDMLEPWASERP